MKVGIIGATSQSTPALFQSLAQSPVRSQMRFALAARNPARLRAVRRAIDLIGSFQIECYDCTPTGLTQTVEDADAVVIQIRYGGLQGREFDEAFPLAFGICGDEGLGPGGLSAAWRSWPQLSELLHLIDRTNRKTKVLLLTSPGSLLTRLACNSFPRLTVRGLCELPMTTLGDASVPYDYIGINHLGWTYGLLDRAPVPLKYWRLQTESKAVIAEQKNRLETRAAELQRLTNNAMRAYSTGTREQIDAAIATRPAPWYSHALAPLLESFLTRDSRHHFFFSERNNEWNDSFDNEDVLEIPYRWEDGQLNRRPTLQPPPANLITTLMPLVDYERIAAEAVLARDASAIEHALACHPWVTLKSQAAGLARAVVTQKLAREAVA